MTNLTAREWDILRAAQGPCAVISRHGLSGFSRQNWERSMKKLCGLGYATPSPHGDYYRTEAGRAALADQGGAS